MRIWVFIYFLFSIQFGQIIYHQPISTAPAKSDLPVEAVIGDYGSGVDKAYIFFRTYNQFDFIQIEMVHLYGELWQGTIPYNFLDTNLLEYYIVAETNTGGILSYPLYNPSENPLRIRIDYNFTFKKEKRNVELTKNNDAKIIEGDESNALILSPNPNEYVQLEDIFIAISLLAVNDIDYNSITAEINGEDYSNEISVQGDIVSINPSNLTPGTYLVRIFFNNKSGIAYKPVTWKFISVLDEIPKENSEFKYSGRLFADRTQAKIDQQNFDVNNYNLEWKGVWDFATLKFKSKLTSLEDPMQQPRNRYTATFQFPYLNIKLGDVNPKINNYAFNGYRIRGLDFNFSSKYFNLNYANGQVLRKLQGDPNYDAMFVDLEKSIIRTIPGQDFSNDTINSIETSIFSISEFIDEINTSSLSDQFSNTDSIHFLFNRSDYEFQQDVKALNLNLGLKNKLELNLNIIKVKDNQYSVNNYLGNANIWLNKSRSIKKIEKGFCSNVNNVNIPLPDSTNIQFDEYKYMELFFDSNQSFDYEVTELINYSSISGIDTTCSDLNYVDQLFDTLQFYEFTFADFFLNSNNILKDDIDFSYEILNKDWSGDKPKDNLVIGSDINFSLDNQKINLNAGFALSMYNQNIWDPVISKEDLDTLFDDSVDGYIGRIYDNNNIISSGMSLDEIDLNPEKYSKYFHINFNQIPISPIDVSRGEIGLNEIMTMPSLLYHVNLRLFYAGHSVNYAFRQVGPEFMSLVNPFIQKNIRETQISDRIGLFQNRLYLNYKWKNTIDGIDPSVENLMKTNNHDININLYPGIGLPTFSFGVGIQKRTNDILDIDPETLFILSQSPDTVINWEGENIDTRKLNVLVTTQLKFLGNHNISFNIFESNKIDYLSKTHVKLNPDYVSQTSENQTYSFNIKSKLSPKWETTTFLNSNRYSLGEDDTYQEQKVILFDFSALYKINKKLKYLKNGLNYTTGTGTNSFSQFSYKMGLEYELIDQLILRTNYEYRYKTISDRSIGNSMIIFNLGYKF